MELHDKYRCNVEVDGWQRGHDFVIGISSYNNAGFVVQTLRCLKKVIKEFNDQRISVVNLDCNSTDGTKREFLDFRLNVDQIYISALESDNVYGKNFYNLLSEVEHFDDDVQTVAYISPLSSFTFQQIYDIISDVHDGEKDLSRLSAQNFDDLDFNLLKSVRQKLGYSDEGIASSFAFKKEKFSEEVLDYKWKEFTWQGGVSSLLSTIALLRSYDVSNTEVSADYDHDFIRANLYQTYDCIRHFDLLNKL